MTKPSKRSHGIVLYSTIAVVIGAIGALWALIALVPPQAGLEEQQIRARAESIDTFPVEVKDYAQYPQNYELSRSRWIELTDHCGYDITQNFDKQATDASMGTAQPSGSAESGEMTLWCQYARDAYLSPKEKMMLAAEQTKIELRQFGQFAGYIKPASAEPEAASDMMGNAESETESPDAGMSNQTPSSEIHTQTDSSEADSQDT